MKALINVSHFKTLVIVTSSFALASDWLLASVRIARLHLANHINMSNNQSRPSLPQNTLVQLYLKGINFQKEICRL